MKNYLKYSGLAFQMGGTIAAFCFLGHYIDGKMQNQTKYFTLFFTLFAVVGSIVKLIFDLTKNNEKDN